MNTLRLSTLSLTLAIGVMTLGYVNPSLAKPECPGHPSCKDDGGGSTGITYTVELTGRVFPIAPPVTVKEDGKLVSDSAETLTFSRPSDAAARDAWDAVFAACENFFGTQPILGPTPVTVSGFEVSADNWQVQKPGGVRLQMFILFDIEGNSPPENGGPYVQVWLQLIGDTLFENPKSPWLPVVPGSFIDYNIVNFWITGKTVKGVRPKTGCVSGGSAEQVDFDTGQTRTLRITLPLPPPE